MSPDTFFLLRQLNISLPSHRFFTFREHEIYNFLVEPSLCIELSNERYVAYRDINIKDIQLACDTFIE